MQHDLLIRVAKVHIVKHHAALKTLIGRCVAVLMIMLPRPHSRVLLCLSECAVHFLRIDQHDITVVCLWLFVQHLENAVCAGECHDNRVKLHTHLIDRHVKALVEGEEARKSAQRKPPDIAKRQDSADNRAYHIAQIAKLCIDWSKHVRKLVRVVRALKQLFIQLIKTRHALFLVAEYLHHLLPFHHLLDKSVHSTDCGLLCHEISAGKSGRLLGHKQHERYHN